MEYERIREEALLSDEEIGSLIYVKDEEKLLPGIWLEFLEILKGIAQAQLDKVLKDKRVHIEADNQDLPKIYNQAVYTESNRMTERAFLTPKDNEVWVKCKVKEK